MSAEFQIDKVECAFSMVILSEFGVRQLRNGDHQKDATHFISDVSLPYAGNMGRKYTITFNINIIIWIKYTVVNIFTRHEVSMDGNLFMNFQSNYLLSVVQMGPFDTHLDRKTSIFLNGQK